ncbi:nuclear receptor subfamily 5 group A member 2-like [Gymnodraco acuticeps]|uniref:Nuclear receptor subfamily 5 group A member 2-like n=1 Tax=Gymnodraco acuticeps TaxID=8218 RepID=A0A6P8TL96_GYMAC|nr:nuclear receptor subfamily 5 group A member 2-like [Gymnodraco acuticeps]
MESRQALCLIELCPVCGDQVSGYHYGLLTCESCKGFFKRTVQNNKQYVCAEQQECTIDRGQRKRCPSCRFLKCLHVGMRLEAVRADRKRGGRNKFGPMYKRDRALKQQRDALIQDGGFRLDSGSSTHHRNLTFTTGFHPLPMIPNTSLPTAQPPHLCSLLPSTQYQSTSFSNWKSQHSNNGSPGPRDGKSTHILYSSPSSRIHSFSPPAPSMPQLVMEFLRCDPDELQLQSKISARILQEEENGTPNTFSLMCVMADQTLFSIVEWARTSIFFKQLKVDDQMKLLHSCWSDLLLLDTVCRNVLQGRENSLLLVTGQEMELSYVASHAGLTLASLVQRGQDLVEKLLILKVDRQEFACIKFLVLFNPDVKQLEDPQFVESVHEQAESSLLEYTLSTSSHLIGRFAHLLLCLSEIRSLSTLAEDYLYCKHLSGGGPCNNLLIEMLHAKRSCA